MSGRALRRLREERQQDIPFSNKIDEESEDDDDDDDEEDDEDTRPRGKGGRAFLAMMDDSSDESDEEDEDSSEDEASEKHTNGETSIGKDESNDDPHKTEELTGNKVTKKEEEQPKKTRAEKAPNENEKEEEEDLDEILASFRDQDNWKNEAEGQKPGKSSSPSWFGAIVAGIDPRDLDIDHVMRANLLGNVEGQDIPSNNTTGRRTRQKALFGPPRDGWARPPHYVGGGIGMTSYEHDQDPRPLPWPYCMKDDNEESEEWKDRKRWFRYMHADTYDNDCRDYERIRDTGDANALAMFVAHHPFVTEALLQLAMVLYHTNQNQDGLALLRRTIWVYECSSPSSFSPLTTATCFMDYDQPENKNFFMALFRLVQVSSIAGCLKASLAISRYLLALDPLRDPMGVLLIMDYFTLALMDTQHDAFLVGLVESGKIKLFFRREQSDTIYEGSLLDMPNWAYSYALALYRMEESFGETSQERPSDSKTSMEALQDAVRAFPSVVTKILAKNDVDVKGRSFRTDWPAALASLREIQDDNEEEQDLDARPAYQVIMEIFVERGHKLWAENAIQTWLHDACVTAGPGKKPKLSPALTRYSRVSLEDYADRFRTLPPEANPLDPVLLGPALAVDPNRRRLLRANNNNRGQQPFAGGLMNHGQQNQEAFLLGPPNQVIDPDLPLMEVFWRSMLPWNHVGGVPPPRR